MKKVKSQGSHMFISFYYILFLVSGTNMIMKRPLQKHRTVQNNKVPSNWKLSNRFANVLREMKETMLPNAKMYEVTEDLISGGRISTETGQQRDMIPMLGNKK